MKRLTNSIQNWQDFLAGLIVHKKRFVACPDYKSDLVKQMDEAYIQFHKDYYKAMVNDNKVAHRRARMSLFKLWKLNRKVRAELQHRKRNLPTWAEAEHPSWKGIED